jgi:hypothetical protein
MLGAVNRIVFVGVLVVAPAAWADDPGASASVDAAASASVEFDPIDSSGWPKNLSLDDLRELPECTSPLPHTPGARVTCRPRIDSSGLQWGLGFDWTTGAVFSSLPTLGGAHAFGVEADFALARTVQLAARYELGGIALASPMPGVDGGTWLSQHFIGMLKYRLFADEVQRNGWVFGIGGGVALRGDELGGSAPIGRVSLARELGAYSGGSTSVATALELALEHSQVGDVRVDAALASVRLGFETNVREPEGLGRPAPKRWRHTTSIDFLLSPFLGLGMSLGLRASPHWSLEASGSFMFDITRDDKLHGFDGAQWAGLVGPRWQSGTPSFAPFYIQAQAGGAWVSKEPSGEARGIGQLEIGLRGLVGCNSAVDLGAWIRDDFQTGDITAGGLMMRVVAGSGGGGAVGGSYVGSCGHGDLALAMPPPPPAPAPVVATSTTTYEAHVPDVVIPEVHVQANVAVEVPKPEPVIIELDLGAAIPGFSLRLDPRLLPLARLRGAGFVSIELSGPSGEMPHFMAELQGTLSRNGVRIDAITNAGDSSAVFHAKFTIWPPGTHP